MDMRPRIRTLKPEMWQDERVAGLSRDARLLVLGLITMADDEGRFRAGRSAIAGLLYPEDDDAYELIPEWVKEVRDSGMIVFYTVDGRPYGAFRHWRKHQKINRPSPSEFPPPPDRKIARENAVSARDESGNFKKSAIPEKVRREVAKAAGAVPGTETVTECHWCGTEGKVVWSRTANGKAGSWVTFSGLELDHVVPEFDGGATTAENLVLACVSCNRKRGHRNGDQPPEHGMARNPATHPVLSERGMPDQIRSVPDPDPVVLGLTERLAAGVRANDPKFDLAKARSARWLTDMRLLLADRNGDAAEVERVIDFCVTDSFERANVLSPAKLRSRFTSLVVKAEKRVTVGEVVQIRPNDRAAALAARQAAGLAAIQRLASKGAEG